MSISTTNMALQKALNDIRREEGELKVLEDEHRREKNEYDRKLREIERKQTELTNEKTIIDKHLPELQALEAKIAAKKQSVEHNRQLLDEAQEEHEKLEKAMKLKKAA